MPEVLTKISLVHSSQGFFRTGNLSHSSFAQGTYSRDFRLSIMTFLSYETSAGVLNQGFPSHSYNAGRAGLGWMNG